MKHISTRHASIARIGHLTAAFVLLGCLSACAQPGAAPGAASATTAPAPLSFILITPPPSADSALVASAVESTRAIAAKLGASLDVYKSSPAVTVQSNVDAAIAAHPTVIIGLTDAVLGDFDPAAASNLSQQFVLIDTAAAEPTENLTSATFRSYEGTYLTGVEAGLLTTSGVVGLIAPDDNPLARAWTVPFTAGATSANAKVDSRVGFVGGDDAQSNQTGIDRAASALARRGADYLQTANLASGISLVAAASALPASADGAFATFATGADGCSAAPGVIVDSVVKKADVALEATLRDVLAGTTGGATSFGLAEGGVSLASLDASADARGTDCLIGDDPAALKRVAAARDAIVDGTITVADPVYAG